MYCSVSNANAESLRKRIEYFAETSKAECDKLKFDLVSIRDRSLMTADSLKKTTSLLPDIRSGLVTLEHELQTLVHNSTDKHTRLVDKVDRNWQEHSQKLVQMHARVENMSWSAEQNANQLSRVTNKTASLEEALVKTQHTDAASDSSSSELAYLEIDRLKDDLFQMNDTMVGMTFIRKNSS